MNDNYVKDITNIEEDFSKWYTDIVLKAELADYTDTKGCIAIRPYGYEIWENKIHELTGVKTRCIPFKKEKISNRCVYCGKDADIMVVWGRQY